MAEVGQMSDGIAEVDAATRKVTGKITFDRPDGLEYILGYCPEAFADWRGAIHEMYDPAKPAGKVLEIIPHSEEHAITIVSRVSEGAQDTWSSILNGALSTYGVSCVPDPEYGNNPQKWPKREYNGREYPYLPRYILAGISYVGKPPVAKEQE